MVLHNDAGHEKSGSKQVNRGEHGLKGQDFEKSSMKFLSVLRQNVLSRQILKNTPTNEKYNDGNGKDRPENPSRENDRSELGDGMGSSEDGQSSNIHFGMNGGHIGREVCIQIAGKVRQLKDDNKVCLREETNSSHC